MTGRRPLRSAWRGFSARLSRNLLAPVYAALVVVFLFQVGRFYDPHTGFTSLVIFGEVFAPERLTQLRELPIFTYRHSFGYDGQFYAQLAVAGNPFDPQLRTALDDPPYRSSRVLLPVLVHLAGLGHPAWVVNAYALSNVVCWLTLAWVMARWWFPPASLDNLVRWGGVLFGAVMLTSVTRSLVDGPALLSDCAGRARARSRAPAPRLRRARRHRTRARSKRHRFGGIAGSRAENAGRDGAPASRRGDVRSAGRPLVARLVLSLRFPRQGPGDEWRAPAGRARR